MNECFMFLNIIKILKQQIAGSWRLVFGVASIVLLLTGAVFLALGKGVPQPWIPSVPRPQNYDIIYEQDIYELDYEDVGVQTEPYDPYLQDDDDNNSTKSDSKNDNTNNTTVIVTSNE